MGKENDGQGHSTAKEIPRHHGGLVKDPNPNDVLKGRGGRINSHTGNVQFRQLCAQHKRTYLSKQTKKLQKVKIAEKIVHIIRTMDPPGRFLEEAPDKENWLEIGDKAAKKKAGQAMRENADETRRELDQIETAQAIQENQTAVQNQIAAALLESGTSLGSASSLGQPGNLQQLNNAIALATMQQQQLQLQNAAAQQIYAGNLMNANMNGAQGMNMQNQLQGLQMQQQLLNQQSMLNDPNNSLRMDGMSLSDLHMHCMQQSIGSSLGSAASFSLPGSGMMSSSLLSFGSFNPDDLQKLFQQQQQQQPQNHQMNPMHPPRSQPPRNGFASLQSLDEQNELTDTWNELPNSQSMDKRKLFQNSREASILPTSAKIDARTTNPTNSTLMKQSLETISSDSLAAGRNPNAPERIQSKDLLSNMNMSMNMSDTSLTNFVMDSLGNDQNNSSLRQTGQQNNNQRFGNGQFSTVDKRLPSSENFNSQLKSNDHNQTNQYTNMGPPQRGVSRAMSGMSVSSDVSMTSRQSTGSWLENLQKLSSFRNTNERTVERTDSRLKLFTENINASTRSMMSDLSETMSALDLATFDQSGSMRDLSGTGGSRRDLLDSNMMASRRDSGSGPGFSRRDLYGSGSSGLGSFRRETSGSR